MGWHFFDTAPAPQTIGQAGGISLASMTPTIKQITREYGTARGMASQVPATYRPGQELWSTVQRTV
jgi:hypothetical protein